jgi:chloramphenicol 3-O-phosphotransferase
MPGATAMFLLTGPSAAGKSTVARLLAERFPRGAHVEGDVFRRSVVAGRADMTPEPSGEALSQLRLRYRLAVHVADMYLDAGFTVVLEDVIAGPLLEECAGLIRGRPLHVVVLLPSTQALRAREASRPDTGYANWSIEQLHDVFVRETPRLGHWLDNSGQSPDETVDEILRLTARA